MEWHMEWHVNGMRMQISRHFFQDSLKLREIFFRDKFSSLLAWTILVCVKPHNAVYRLMWVIFNVLINSHLGVRMLIKIPAEGTY